MATRTSRRKSVRTRNIIVATLLAVLMGPGVSPSAAQTNPDIIETGRLLAILLDSGRVTIAGVQSLVNDLEKGDKGYTPDVFELQLIKKFKERSGVDLVNLRNEKVPPKAKLLLPMLVESCKKVVATYQPIINKQGLGYKNFIPATFGTQCSAIFTAKTGAYLKQTTLDDVLRNPKNKADEFEAVILQRFADPAYPRQGEKIISAMEDGGKTARVMLPLYHGPKCLVCHGEPKDVRDISGYLREGKKEGDLAGAISVKLPVK